MSAMGTASRPRGSRIIIALRSEITEDTDEAPEDFVRLLDKGLVLQP